MTFVIGTPGSAPRFTMDSSLESAQAQLKSGEVCFPQDTIPPAPYAINPEGTALVAVPLDSAEASRRAWAAVKMTRNAKLAHFAWTVAPGSPLSETCQAAWLAWFKTMNRVTVDFNNPSSVTWPEEPALEYST